MNKSQSNREEGISKLFFLLEELKDNFSEKLLEDTLECFHGEVGIGGFLGQDENRLREVLNGQHEKFYDGLALEFVEDLNNFPEMYFLIWETLLYYFDETSSQQFYKTALEIAGTSNASDYINGMKYLEAGDQVLANMYFSRIDDYVADYFIGLVYFELDAYENAIKCNENFLDGFLEMIETSKKNVGDDIGISNDFGVEIALWNVHNDLGYLYIRTTEYEKAKFHYEKGLEIFDIEFTYKIKREDVIDESRDEFTIWANNYMMALEKTGEKHKANEILGFVIPKYLSNEYFKQKRKEFEKPHPADDIIKQVFAPKKPFNISKHEQVKFLSKEKSLEDMLIEQMKYGYHVFNRPLEVYNDKFYGRQYFIKDGYGILDLLLIDKSTDTLYVVELKREQAGLEVISQTEKYIEGLTIELNREVKGIICLHGSNAEIKKALSDKPSIELFSYHFDFVKQ